MFTGKKISNGFVNQQVQHTNGKLIQTKITDQLLGKPKLNACNTESKSINLHMDNAQSKIQQKKTKSKDNQKKQQKQIKSKNKNSQKTKEYVKEIGKQIKFKQTKQLQKSQPLNSKQNQYKEVKQIKAQQLDSQQIPQHELSGENNFIHYEPQQEDNDIEREIPIPMETAQQNSNKTEEIKQCKEIDMNMQVFCLGLDQIMSKEYFIV